MLDDRNGFFLSGKAKLDPETMKIGFSVKNSVYTLSGKLIARRNDQFLSLLLFVFFVREGQTRP